MILRKPYAFLIKHFKMIHLLLCVPIIYLIIRTGRIASFFSSYVRANYYTNLTNIAGTYINYFMYIAIIVIILLVLTVFFLMRQKKKDTRFYLFLLIYYIILLVLLSVSHSVLNSIEQAQVTAQTVRSYRDIAYIVYVPQFFFAIYTVLRGIGFDIKKFNFEEDAKELEITDFDNEEFELVIGKDSYKYKRKIRRFIREFKYYVLENKLTFGILAAFIVVVCGTLLYLNFGVYNKKFHQTQRITHNNLMITVVDSVLSNMDLGGNKITDGKYYLAIALKIKNNSDLPSTLDYENFQIEVAKRRISATLDRSSYFADLGLTYSRDTKIPANSENTYVLTYEIDESLKDEKIVLKILESLDIQIGSVTSNYKTVELDYEKAFDTQTVRTVGFNKILELSSARLGMLQLQIQTSTLGKTYEYTYQSCTNSNCQNVKNKAVADSGKTLLVLDRMLQLDPYSNYYLARKGSSQFVSDFLKVRYELDGVTKTSTITDKSVSTLPNTWIFQLPSEVERASKIELLLNLRGSIYVMELNG